MQWQRPWIKLLSEVRPPSLFYNIKTLSNYQLDSWIFVVVFNQKKAWRIRFKAKYSMARRKMKRKTLSKNKKKFRKNIVGSKYFTANMLDDGHFTINIQNSENLTVNITDSRGFTVNISDSRNYQINEQDCRAKNWQAAQKFNMEPINQEPF